jgi:hypothetical protein
LVCILVSKIYIDTIEQASGNKIAIITAVWASRSAD